MRIAMAGNPNSGKTTMFNALTGKSEKVGNWAGVTVDKKENPIKKSYCNGKDIIAVDLPGTYSISPYTSEESVARDYIVNEKPDVLINIVDATNLSRSLFFTTQLLELGVPMVVALNKTDLNEKKGTKIAEEKLSQLLGCPIIKTSSKTGEGLENLIETALKSVGNVPKPPFRNKYFDPDDRTAAEAADCQRYEFVNCLVKQVEQRKVLTSDRTLSDKIDTFITNPIVGLLIFAGIMWLVFQISQAWLGPYIADTLVALLEQFQGWVGGLLTDASPLLSALLVDGVIGGVIAVLGFLPLVMIMYFLIAILEDCGYMARAAVVLDPIFKKVGLSGKSVIPFVMTIGCAVPGIMASRTIRNERERRATAMLAPFMPCGAKIPVIALFSGVFFSENKGIISFVVYLTGIALIFLGALLVNLITGHRAKNSFFIIELPEYKFPSLWGAFKSMCSRGWEYIVKAATIILLCNTAVQIMQSFTWSFKVAEQADQSILATLASPFAYLLVPVVGVLSWQLAAAAITGFIAKENVVGTLAVCFVGLENLIDTEELALMEGAGAGAASVMEITKVAALAYLTFNLYSPPCFAAIGAMNSEMKSRKWFWGGIGLQFAVGYTIAYLIYTIGTLITAPATLDIPSALWGMALVAVMAGYIVYLISRADKSVKAEYSLES